MTIKAARALLPVIGFGDCVEIHPPDLSLASLKAML